MLISILADIEQEKELWGLGNIDFGDIKIGKAICKYNYINNELVECGQIYPLTVDDSLILWATPSGSGYQISQGLTDEINNNVGFDIPFALIYDVDSVYAYKGGAACYLADSGMTVTGRV